MIALSSEFTATGDWTELVQRITRGDETGLEDLYAILIAVVRANLWRVVGADSFEDRLHEILLIVLEAVQTEELRDPEKLPAFIRTVARRQMVAHIRGASASRRRFVSRDGADAAAPARESPEAHASDIERVASVRAAVLRLIPRDREIIQRFYFEDQSARKICLEMHLTSTQFRLYKSRAIAKCTHLLVIPEEPRAFSRPIPSGLRIA